MKYGVAINLLFWKNQDFLKGKNWALVFSKLKAMNITDIEVPANPGFFQDEEFYKKYLSFLSSNKEKYGIKKIALHSGISMSDGPGKIKKMLTQFKKELERNKILDPDLIVIHPDMTIDDFGKKDLYLSKLQIILKELLALCNNYNIKLAVENLRRCIENFPQIETTGIDIKDLVTLINEINNPNIGICIDAGHAYINQPLMKGKIAFCKDKLFHFHASDNFGVYDDHMLPGTGKINWKDIFIDLKAINYSGTYLLEVVPNNKTYEDMGFRGDIAILETGSAFFEYMRSKK